MSLKALDLLTMDQRAGAILAPRAESLPKRLKGVIQMRDATKFACDKLNINFLTRYSTSSVAFMLGLGDNVYEALDMSIFQRHILPRIPYSCIIPTPIEAIDEFLWTVKGARLGKTYFGKEVYLVKGVQRAMKSLGDDFMLDYSLPRFRYTLTRA